MIAVNRDIRLAKEELIKFVKGMNDGKGFFFNLSVSLFSWRERAGTVGDWLPLDVARAIRVSDWLKQCRTKAIFRGVYLEYHRGIYVEVSQTRCLGFCKGVGVLLRPEKFLFDVSEVTERADNFAQIWAELGEISDGSQEPASRQPYLEVEAFLGQQLLSPCWV